jgi:hypothetical protein
MKIKKILPYCLTIFLVLSISVSCNLFINSFQEFKENNDPDAFRSVAMVSAHKEGGNMYRLAFGTSSRAYPDNRIEVNDSDGSIVIHSSNNATPPNAGKIAGSEDGIVYYFKEVPADKNFKLSADFEVELFGVGGDLNGQEAWGLMARDYVPQYPGWTMAETINKGNTDNLRASENGGTGNMVMVGGVKRGVRVYWRTGVTDPSGGDAIINSSVIADASKAEFYFIPRELPDYSIYPNLDARPDFPSVGTKYSLYLEKTNSGFKIEITPPAGKGGDLNYRLNPYDPQPANPVEISTGQKLVYELSEPDLLFSIDKEFYYVGFFAARCARVKITNIYYEEADISSCAPRVDRLPDIYSPSIDIYSPVTASTAEYIFNARANVEGNIAISLNGNKLPEQAGIGEWTVERTNAIARPFTNFIVPVSNLRIGDNVFQLIFYPDKNQNESGLILSSTEIISKTFIVNRRSYGDSANGGNIYISPEGRRTGDGTRDNPLDIDTAIAYVQPGQKIIMMDGVYNPLQVLIPRNNSGKPNPDSTGNHPPNLNSYKNPDGSTHDYYKYFKVLEAENRDKAVIDFMGHPQNRAFEIRGDYWILSGFHLRGTAPIKRKGITVMGSYNRVEWLKIYLNGDTGLQISGESNEPKILWPSYNIISHCDSFYNRDLARVDADGFAAKLTVGEGNRFEWCAAYNNTDDGWDLFTKKESGVIGVVEIDYCLAYLAGYILKEEVWNNLPNFPTNWDTVEGGNGNGFKVGGEGLSVRHHVRHSLAFRNKADGFTSNSNPALYLTNCTAFDNAYNPSRSGRNYAIYGSENGGSPIGLDARITQILSMYPEGSIRTDDRLWLRADPNSSISKDPPPTNVGFAWLGNVTQNRSSLVINVANNVEHTNIPWLNGDEIGIAPFSNEITGQIKGFFVARNPDGSFKLNNFMKTKNINGTQPGCVGLYR